MEVLATCGLASHSVLQPHEDGNPCFDGDWFIVGVDTPQGSYTYHYHEEYWDMFDCLTLERAKHWDGHTDKDVERLLSLEEK